MIRRPICWFTSAALLVGTMPAPGFAQPGMPPQNAPATVPGQNPAAQAPGYSAPQLDSILAPVALYPDVLLTQVLMAAAYPLQIVEAYRWVRQPANRNLRGDALARALVSRNWDPSVKSLVPFPALLAQLNGNLTWLQQLGYAAVNQQAEVLDAVQRLRQQAVAAGNLRTTEQCVVRTEERIIYIEPPTPSVVYLPSYNPTTVYGAWAYPAYPPVYLPPPPGYVFSPALGGVLAFGTAIAVGALLWDIGRPQWGQRNIYINRDRYNAINVRRPQYRGGEVWHPSQTATYPTGGGGWRNPPGPTGGPGRGRAFGGPGGGQGHGQDFRQQGGHGQQQKGGQRGGQGRGRGQDN